MNILTAERVLITVNKLLIFPILNLFQSLITIPDLPMISSIIFGGCLEII